MDLHETIIGLTGSGKTFYAQQKARVFVRYGRKTLVLRKPREVWPQDAATWQTDDPDRFQWMFWRAKGCACFMELADAAVNKYDDTFHKMFSMGRHEGHRCFYLSQYGPQVHPIIRINCTSLAMFASSKAACAKWAEEFNDDAILRAVDLEPMHFIFKPSRYKPARFLQIKV